MPSAPPSFVLDHQRLDQIATSHAEEYAAGYPFPHIVIDDFLPEEWLNSVLAEFPPRDDSAWHKRSTRNSLKLSCNDTSALGPSTQVLINLLNSHDMLRFLENLTSISGLIPDTHLFGGGLHQILSGGFLKIHADFNKHPEWHLNRRLNALLFLNRDWQEEYGGHFELWDSEMSKCHRRVLPVFNRLVVFTTTDTSFHGHPEPLCCPEQQSRKSIALYYYTNGMSGASDGESHSTLYQARPGVDHRHLRVRDISRSLIKPFRGLVQRLRRAG